MERSTFAKFGAPWGNEPRTERKTAEQTPKLVISRSTFCLHSMLLSGVALDDDFLRLGRLQGIDIT